MLNFNLCSLVEDQTYEEQHLRLIQAASGANWISWLHSQVSSGERTQCVFYGKTYIARHVSFESKAAAKKGKQLLCWQTELLWAQKQSEGGKTGGCGARVWSERLRNENIRLKKLWKLSLSSLRQSSWHVNPHYTSCLKV